AAEEKRCVPEIESTQTFERRALQGERPHGAFVQPPLETDVAQQEFLEVLLEERGELVDVFVGREGPADGAVLVEEKALAEGLERFALARAGFGVVRIAGRRLAHPPVDEDVGMRLSSVGSGALLVGFRRLLQLPLGARVEARPVLAVELRWQRRSEAGPEDADEEVAVRRPDEFLVEMGRRPQRLLFP